MFARIKKSGRYQYLQIVENRRNKGKISQRVIGTVGRLDRLHAKGNVETLIRSLARYSEKTLLVLSGKSEVNAHSKKIGPALIFERLWRELGIAKVSGAGEPPPHALSEPGVNLSAQRAPIIQPKGFFVSRTGISHLEKQPHVRLFHNILECIYL